MMHTQIIDILNPKYQRIVQVEVSPENDFLGGTINLAETPESIQKLFEFYEELVNTQVFSLVDETQEKILAECPYARLEDGRIIEVRELQPCPSDGLVAIWLASMPSSLRNGTSHEHLSGKRQVH